MPVLHGDLDTPVNYARLDYKAREHHRRYSAYVKANGLTCQDCGGMGEYLDDVIDGYLRVYHACGWCEGTGKMTRHLRGQWLRVKREEKRGGHALRHLQGFEGTMSNIGLDDDGNETTI